MRDQLWLRFKAPAGTRDLPKLDAEQRTAMRALPTEIVRGIGNLYRQPAPRVTNPDVWPSIVADSLYIATAGWAADALALGWEPLELFGCAADPHGDDDLLGLAARLDGRDILVITESAVLVRGNTESSILHRKPQSAATIYLWDFGR